MSRRIIPETRFGGSITKSSRICAVSHDKPSVPFPEQNVSNASLPVISKVEIEFDDFICWIEI
jgi:hypothetical protein